MENSKVKKFTTNKDRILAKDGSTLAIALANGSVGALDMAEILCKKLNKNDEMKMALDSAQVMIRSLTLSSDKKANAVLLKINNALYK